MTQLEKEIEAQLVRLVKKHGGLCLKWVSPNNSGVPDRIILLPGGRLIFAELKRPKGGRLSKLQIWWRQKLQSLGFRCIVVWSAADILELKTQLETEADK